MSGHSSFPVGAWRNIVIFAVCAGLTISVYSMTITLSSLIAETYTASLWMLTFPVAALVTGSFIASIPTSAIIARLGRKRTFLLASFVGLLGAVVIAGSMLAVSWSGILSGYFIVGLGLSATEFYVFAANDGVPKQFAGRVSGAILLGGLVAAVVGPHTGRFAQSIEIMQVPLLAVPIAIMILLAMQFFLLGFINVTGKTSSTAQQRMSFSRIGLLVRKPMFWSAVLVTSCGYGVMTLIMNATTSWMFDHGMMLDHSTMVISSHIVGMFAPALISGWIADRFGTIIGAVLGFALMGLCMVILMIYQEYEHFLIALVLLGVGWSLTQVSGTKRVILLAKEEDKAEFEGGNVLLMTFAKICSSMSAGALYITWGSWGVLSVSAFFMLIGLIAVVILPLFQPVNRGADETLF